jgi:hypothetical protein
MTNLAPDGINVSLAKSLGQSDSFGKKVKQDLKLSKPCAYPLKTATIFNAQQSLKNKYSHFTKI